MPSKHIPLADGFCPECAHEAHLMDRSRRELISALLADTAKAQTKETM